MPKRIYFRQYPKHFVLLQDYGLYLYYTYGFENAVGASEEWRQTIRTIENSEAGL